MSYKRRRQDSKDKLLRLLPECKLPKLSGQQLPSQVVHHTLSLHPTPVLQSPALTPTIYHSAVDLASMSKTAIAYYTALQSAAIIPDRLAAKVHLKAQSAKCSYCGKPLEDDSAVRCTGKCGKFCHPSCGCVLEQRQTGLKWVCLRCAGVPRP